MANDKYDFIIKMIENKNISPAQKDRILLLSAQEMKKDFELLDDRLRKLKVGYQKDADLLERIEKIEIMLKEIKEQKETRENTSAEQENLKEPNPKHVADFMSLFNQRSGLKYLTHDFDENSDFDIDKFLISANMVFIKKTDELNIPRSLWRIVKQYAFDSKQTEWTSISDDYKKPISITIGWASKELRDWSKKNQLHPIRNNEYERIINDFRRITRIEPPNLEKLVNTALQGVFEKELDNFEIIKVSLKKADFFSHIGFLKAALHVIFEEMKRRSDSPEKKKISINYERFLSDEGYYLRKVLITHHHSFPTKELKLILKEWQEKGNMGKIKEKLKGYCHWSVVTQIEGVPLKVNILRENDIPEYEHVEYIPDGFTHILTYYYK